MECDECSGSCQVLRGFRGGLELCRACFVNYWFQENRARGQAHHVDQLGILGMVVSSRDERSGL